MSNVASSLWPVLSIALRSTALIAVALVLIFVLLPAALGAAGPQVQFRG
jgi:hypothetical protein